MDEEKDRGFRIAKVGSTQVDIPDIETRGQEGGRRVDGPLFELNGLPGKAAGESGYFRANLNETATAERFSIVREFYEKCDLESRLILIDVIPEVGESKELAFLRKLAEDEVPEIRTKALEACRTLENRLQNQTEDLDCSEPDESGVSPENPARTRRNDITSANFTPDFKNIRETTASRAG